LRVPSLVFSEAPRANSWKSAIILFASVRVCSSFDRRVSWLPFVVFCADSTPLFSPTFRRGPFLFWLVHAYFFSLVFCPDAFYAEIVLYGPSLLSGWLSNIASCLMKVPAAFFLLLERSQARRLGLILCLPRMHTTSLFHVARTGSQERDPSFFSSSPCALLRGTYTWNLFPLYDHLSDLLCKVTTFYDVDYGLLLFPPSHPCCTSSRPSINEDSCDLLSRLLSPMQKSPFFSLPPSRL